VSIIEGISVPPSWTLHAFGRVTSRVQIAGRPDLEPLSVFLDEGVVPRSSREDNHNQLGEDLGKYLVVQPGDIVFNKLRTWQGGLGVSRHEGIVSPAYFVCRPTSDYDPRYLHYLLHSQPYLQELTRISKWMPPSQFDIGWEQLRLLPVIAPNRVAQGAIADYLDKETVRIDALIAKKRRIIDILNEQERSWSIRLVLGDLGDEAGSTSPSGQYRAVPIGWRETALRHLGCDVQTGPFGSQLHAEDYVANGWPVVNPMNIVGGRIIATEHMTVSNEKRQELCRHMLRPGDIVFGRRGEMGRAGLVDDSQNGWLCGTGSLRLRLHDSYLLPEYLKLLLETPAARAYFELASVGSTMDNLNSEIVLAFPTLIPPTSTQREIVQAVERRRRLADVTQERLTRQIRLLVERRQTLITAAVTGELEVPIPEAVV
jgi:type I restriction enzyme, S subunit